MPPPLGLAKEAYRHLARPAPGLGPALHRPFQSRNRRRCRARPRPGPRKTPREAGWSPRPARWRTARPRGRRRSPSWSSASRSLRRAQPWSGHSRNCRTWRSDTDAAGGFEAVGERSSGRPSLEPVAQRRVQLPDPLGGHHRICPQCCDEPRPELLGPRSRRAASAAIGASAVSIPHTAGAAAAGSSRPPLPAGRPRFRCRISSSTTGDGSIASPVGASRAT